MKLKKMFFLLFIFLLTIACGSRTIFLKTHLSSPEHHINTGFLLFERGKFQDAANEFYLALRMNPKAVKAYTGLALVKAAKGDASGAFSFIKKARELAQSDEDRVEVDLAQIRVVYLLYKPKLLPQAKQAFKRIMQQKPGYPPACFYMGQVYERAFLFNKALDLFNKVLKSENVLVLKAYNEIDKIEKILKAAPITNIGKEIGLKDAINRADMAALLVHELKLPQVLELPTVNEVFVKDIGGERFAKEIEQIVPYHLTELSATVDGYFEPDLKITKAAFCEILEDIYVRISGDEGIKNRFKHIRSPYKDLSPRAPYYNACIFALIKGFVVPQDRLNRQFGPLNPVSGADALIGIKRLKKELRLL